MLTTSMPSAQTVEVDSEAAIQEIATSALAGDIETALGVIAELRASGVTQLLIGGQIVTLDELELLIADGLTPGETATLTELLEVAVGTEDVDLVVAAPAEGLTADDDDDDDAFPIGSEG